MSSLHKQIQSPLCALGKSNKEEVQLEVWMKQWEERSATVSRTWRSLFDFLKEIDLDVIAQEIQIHLTSKCKRSVV